MTTLESAIALDLDRGFFDSVETDILSIAFEKAWAFVEFDPMLGVLEVANRRAELARCALPNGATEAWRNQPDVACEFRDQGTA